MIFRQLTRDAFVYGGADLVSKVISFFTFPIVAAVLSPGDYGLLELVLTSTSLLGIFMNVGLNNAVQRFYWQKGGVQSPQLQAKVVSSGFVALLGFGIGVLLLGTLILPLILRELSTRSIELTWLTLWSALALMVLTQLFQFNLDVTRLHFAKWRFFALALLARTLSIFSGLVAVVKLDLGIEGLLTAQLIVLFLAFPFSILAVKKDFLWQSISFDWIRKLVKFGYPFIHAGLAFWIFGSMDRWMLSYMTSIEEVGIYSVAFRFATLLTFVSGAFGQAWSPVAFKVRVDHPDLYRKLYGDVLLVLMFFMLTIGAFVGLFAGELIGLLMPSSYSPSIEPLIVLCFGVALQATQQVTAVGISLEQKTYLFGRLSWVTALVNFLFNLLLIPFFGASGAAFATLLSYFLLTACYFYFTQKLHPLEVSLKKLLIFLGLSCLVYFAAFYWVSSTFQINLLLVKASLLLIWVLIGLKLLPFHTFKRFSR